MINKNILQKKLMLLLKFYCHRKNAASCQHLILLFVFVFHQNFNQGIDLSLTGNNTWSSLIEGDEGS